MKALPVFDCGDAQVSGIGTMREARVEPTYDMLVRSHLLDPKVDWRDTFATQFVQDLQVMP